MLLIPTPDASTLLLSAAFDPVQAVRSSTQAVFKDPLEVEEEASHQPEEEEDHLVAHTDRRAEEHSEDIQGRRQVGQEARRQEGRRQEGRPEEGRPEAGQQEVQEEERQTEDHPADQEVGRRRCRRAWGQIPTTGVPYTSC